MPSLAINIDKIRWPKNFYPFSQNDLEFILSLFIYSFSQCVLINCLQWARNLADSVVAKDTVFTIMVDLKKNPNTIEK